MAGRRITPTATVLALTFITAGVGIAPFILADGANVVHSLITYRSGLPIGGGSFWSIARGTPWAGFAEHGDAYLVLGAAAALISSAAWLRPRSTGTTAGFFGLLTIAAACFPMLAKTVLPYYLLEPYVFAAIWWLARPGSVLNWRMAGPLLLTADVFISKQASTLPLNGLGLGEGIASSTVLAVVIALVAIDLFRGPAAEPSDPSAQAATRQVQPPPIPSGTALA